VVLLTSAVMGAGCNRGGPQRLVLDGRPRFPDAEGLVSAVTFKKLVLDGGREYRITRDLQCFSTYTLAAVPLLQRKGQYVQVGLDGDRVAWLASISAVVKGDQPTVYYTGHLLRVDKKRRAIFRDGTVFKLKRGVEPPHTGFLEVAVDPTAHVVRELR
jgi:hypothetical protein